MNSESGSGSDIYQDLGWKDVFKEFCSLVIKSPVALVSLVISFFFGYGIAFVIFDYRRSDVRKSHYIYHIIIGLGYTACVFSLVNRDLISPEICYADISGRAPLTLLIGFIISFIVIISVSLYREARVPYNKESEDA